MNNINQTQSKYLKYKIKYNKLKKLTGGSDAKLIKAIGYFDGTSNNIKGTVLFEEINIDTVKVSINLTGFAPESIHGFHIHESGDLSKGCESMCAHLNPYNKTHGGREDEIRHVGDLGNIIADSSGNVIMEFTDNQIKLRGIESNIIGRGLIIHADPDDCGKGNHSTSKTTGNSGKRIAGVIIGYASVC